MVIIQPRNPSPEQLADRDASALAARLSGRGRAGTPPQSADPAVPGGSQQTPTPSESAGSNDQIRGLVPEGGENADAAPQSAQPQVQPQATPEGEETPPEGTTTKTQKKWKRLLEQKAEAAAQVAQLQAELERQKAQIAAMQQQPAPPQPQPQAKKAALPEFSKPFPQDGSTEDQIVWRAEKAAHEASMKVYAELLPQQLGESFRNFATVIEPALQHSLRGMVDQQWDAMSPVLDSLGIASKEDRSALRQLAEQEAASNGLDIPSALGRVLFHKNFSGHWQDESPTAQAPAPANPARPAGPARAATGRFQPVAAGGDPVDTAREMRRSGQKAQAEAVMAAYLKTRMGGARRR